MASVSIPRIILVFIVAVGISAAELDSDRLQAEVARLAKMSDGVVGMSAWHVESNRRFEFHGDDRFPMASSYKVPIAVELLARVDRGELRLDQMVTIEPHDLHPGSGMISSLLNKPGVALSLRNLLELMLLISDNSATDIVLRLAGGPQAVTAKMRELNILGIDVSRPTANLIADWDGATLAPENEWTPERFAKAFDAVTPEQSKQAHDRFNQDPRDTAQPNAMAALLEKIYHRQLHHAETADLLLDILNRCQTGDARIKGMLPPGTAVAHKTGSIGGTVNDVGILTLPDNAGHVVLALFVKQGSKSEASERTIAQISRAVYDYFLFNAHQ